VPQNLHELKIHIRHAYQSAEMQCCPLPEVRLIIVLMFVESPVGLTLKFDK